MLVGVYDPTTDTWDWAFTQDLHDGSNNGGPRYLVLGTAAN